MEFTVIFNFKGEWKRAPLEVKKEQSHCTKVTYTGLEWGVSGFFGIETSSFKEW